MTLLKKEEVGHSTNGLGLPFFRTSALAHANPPFWVPRRLLRVKYKGPSVYQNNK